MTSMSMFGISSGAGSLTLGPVHSLGGTCRWFSHSYFNVSIAFLIPETNIGGFTCFTLPRSYIIFTTTLSPRSPARFDSSRSALVIIKDASEYIQKLVAKNTSFCARTMQLAVCRLISGNVEMMVKGTRPWLPINDGDTSPAKGLFSSDSKASW